MDFQRSRAALRARYRDLASREIRQGRFRRNLARPLRRAYEVGPLICSRCGAIMKVVGLITKPDAIPRVLSHLKLGPSEKASRAPPSPASSSGSPREPQYEPPYDDLPWEEPTFEDAPVLDDGEPIFGADCPPEEGPINDSP